MLAYFDTSAHDDQTLREIYGRSPAPEYLAWARERTILAIDAAGRLVRGPNWGNPRQFCQSDEELRALIAATPAAYGFETAGPRPAEQVSRRVRLHQATGRAAIHTDLDIGMLETVADFRVLASEADSKEAHLNSPELGSRLAALDRARLTPEHKQVQIVVSDGLSAAAVHQNVPPLLSVLGDALAVRGIQVGRPMLVRYGRVKIAEQIAAAVACELVVLLVGERPGGDAQAARSLSAYLVWDSQHSPAAGATDRPPANGLARFEYSVVSNIHPAGLPPLEAAGVIAEKILQILTFRAAGNRLEALLEASQDR
jgi:ethanolamine ammonia-lyase large subunit